MRPATPSGALEGERIGSPSEDYLLLERGVRVVEFVVKPVARFGTSSRRLGQWDILRSTGFPPIVNDRAASVLVDVAGEDVQLVSVRVLAEDGEVGPYWAVNATRLVSCIDHQSSVFSMLADAPGQIAGFRRLRLVAGCMRTAILARDDEYHGFLYAAAPLAHALLDAQLRGLNLVAADHAFDHWE
jgi:hypothetical protein